MPAIHTNTECLSAWSTLCLLTLLNRIKPVSLPWILTTSSRTEATSWSQSRWISLAIINVLFLNNWLNEFFCSFLYGAGDRLASKQLLNLRTLLTHSRWNDADAISTIFRWCRLVASIRLQRPKLSSRAKLRSCKAKNWSPRSSLLWSHMREITQSSWVFIGRSSQLRFTSHAEILTSDRARRPKHCKVFVLNNWMPDSDESAMIASLFTYENRINKNIRRKLNLYHCYCTIYCG